MPGEEPQASGPLMMPFLMGAPWVSKFDGVGTVKLGEWKTQIKYMLSVQRLSEHQQVQFVMGFLDGDARREVLALEERDRDTTRKIFDLLAGLYGDITPIAALRAQFFNCRQEPRQSLRSFALHLRELFCRLKSRDETGLEEGDILLRDQFVMGLRDGPIRQELRKQVRRTPILSFEAVKAEALALEHECQEPWEPSACMSAGVGSSSPRSASDWKAEFRKEIMREVQEQMSRLSKTLLDELRGNQHPPREDRRPEGGWRGRRTSLPPTNGFKWDPQGRPICNRCGEVGHISRKCPVLDAPQRDF